MNTKPEMPRRWEWLCRKFIWYVRRDLRKRFHALRISRTSAPLPIDGTPIIVVLNHPAWWDPLICTALLDHFPKYHHYAAIDAIALKKYGVLSRLGFFPVDTKTLRGAAEFLRLAQHILAEHFRTVWLTAQGEFADVRKRPLELRSGVGHLASQLKAGWVLPIAIEYSFWMESTPEALVRFGTPISIGDHQRNGREWTTMIEAELTRTLDALNAETIQRDPQLFETLIGGSSGAGGWYDRFRRVGSWMRGKKFDSSHASALSEKTT